MASNRGYTTATKVKAALGGRVAGYFTDGIIEDAINRVEGIIDTALKVSSSGNIVGANSLTWTTGLSPHWVIEGAATFGAALQLCNGSIVSMNGLDEVVSVQNFCSYMFKTFMDQIENEMFGDFIAGQ